MLYSNIYFKKSGLRFMDTMSMHIACSGFSHEQRSMIITNDNSDLPEGGFAKSKEFWRNSKPVRLLNFYLHVF
jgi:hypothetical protein